MNTRANIEISALSDNEMDCVCGGGSTISLNTNSTISVPHITPRDLLTPQQIASLLSISGSFNPPVPHG